MPVRIGELLLKEKRISPAQLQEVLAYQKANGGKLAFNLVKLGFVKDEEITALLSKQYGVPSINLAQFEIDPAIVKLIPAETAQKYQIVPLSRAGATLTIAMTDPTNVFAMDDIKFMTGYNVEPVVASETAVTDAITRYYPANAPAPRVAAEPKKKKEAAPQQTANLNNAATLEMVTRALEETAGGIADDDVEMLEEIEQIDVSTLEKQGGEAPVIRLVNLMLMSAIQKGASDIHVEPYEKEFRVRFRIDGILYNVMAPPMKFRDAITSRIKIMRKLEMAISKPWGMVLVTGPTGSGKTNTLYPSIAKINTPETNIMTAEDPVEFHLVGVNLVQVKENIGLNFAAALRSFLRQDPNIILVGEIRDFETAEIAVKAALTGHLVLSTLHTNDAPSTINRLMNMGIEPFLVASSVHLICAQRLVRKVCSNCKEPNPMTPEALMQAGFNADDASNVTPYKGAGCDTCNTTGYKGRVGLYEVMEVSEELRELILVGASGLELRRKAIDEGMITLRASGLRKVKEGMTSIEEVVRETVK